MSKDPSKYNEEREKEKTDFVTSRTKRSGLLCSGRCWNAALAPATANEIRVSPVCATSTPAGRSSHVGRSR
ncbi:hypothetical protein EVAR_47878_1 [Eumeta japonica]|uniref:Uncharacterized protein n=1 Tax=Eumeta variegata TaxID=151549 RepID=A0A4C1Y9B7_EUMVA|nr:hypothetical protein EVAR_47878_1 [Eumeta japonica]